MITLLHGDCLDKMREMADGSVDSVVTDPPYGLSFMGKKWDYDVPSEAIWRECLRVLKPGGHLLAFAGTRTQHRMAVRIEDAGFEIRDMIAWVYGSGFPKSYNVAQSIEKKLTIGKCRRPDRDLGGMDRNRYSGDVEGALFADTGGQVEITTDAAREWQGWGTALKPALEPITVARKPLEGTVAANVLAYGTGGLNIDGCRVGSNGEKLARPFNEANNHTFGKYERFGNPVEPQGRWPANFIHDGSEEVLAGFPQSAGQQAPIRGTEASVPAKGDVAYGFRERVPFAGHNDSGSAARFFYCAKASKKDRGGENNHPTVKPLDLMRYLCRLVTPAGGTVLDPFMGSGSTGKAARLEGFRFIGIERHEPYFAIAEKRINGSQEAPAKTLDQLTLF